MNSDNTVLLETDERGVATLTLNRPEIHNAFDDALISELLRTLESVENDAGIRALVLRSEGKSFSAGADLNWMKTAGQASVADNIEDARRLATMLRTLAELRKPTIARVHGAALGGGLGLAAACDLCVAATGAVRAAQPFSNPPPGLVDPETGFIDFGFAFIFEIGQSPKIHRYRR